MLQTCEMYINFFMYIELVQRLSRRRNIILILLAIAVKESQL